MKIALSLISISLLYFGCTKFSFNEYRKNPGIDLRFCNIKTWSDKHGEDDRTNIFSYDEHGNPISVSSNLSGTGNGKHLFTYDDKERLIKYENEFVRTKVYHYEGSGRRAAGATVTDGLGREFSETYTYDEDGRIIRSVLHLVSSPFDDDEIPDDVKEYVYLNDDLNSIIANGVQVNPDVTYSNKPSVYMTNKVWMFVNQNYSRHATTGTETVNRLGLPLKLKAEEYAFPFLDIEGTNSTLTYECR